MPRDLTIDGVVLIRLGKLLSGAMAVIDINPAAARDYIKQASDMLRGAPDPDPVPIPGTIDRHALAPWQAKRLQAYIDLNLGGSISIAELVDLTRLSKSYFFRAFKGSFGMAPHSYVIGRRILRAQGMLRFTDEPLAEIAIACGLADQAHLSRLFRQAVGIPPGAWRRERRGGAILPYDTDGALSPPVRPVAVPGFMS